MALHAASAGENPIRLLGYSLFVLAGLEGGLGTGKSGTRRIDVKINYLYVYFSPNLILGLLGMRRRLFHVKQRASTLGSAVIAVFKGEETRD